MSECARQLWEEALLRCGHPPIESGTGVPQLDRHLRDLAHRGARFKPGPYDLAQILELLNAGYVGRQPERRRARLVLCLDRSIVQRNVAGEFYVIPKEIHRQICGGRCLEASDAAPAAGKG